eukprot:CAMPEP_0181174914 /NCGR_PEP_ID=MMETSP1096-20121128/3795_1 /TAXON_ID=156174 ORGANISM="Chrysochromulina ericina, Strain CCMP281" /NCGR_SAMPLE_ID=MMETSP1096 /ASSEMBLY_ACC=CAM_ASM_000453 /LENGTH=184 /DNA_ID=CAMNT_0023262857 /DNA_START=120 /DNA_END=674 /DNA_ORIENTATION=+
MATREAITSSNDFISSTAAPPATRGFSAAGVQLSTTNVLSPDVWPKLPQPLLELVVATDQLRLSLASACGRPLLDIVELQLLRFPPGGRYARHFDTGVDLAQSPAVRRSISFLLFLTPDSWCPTEGGQLRVYEGTAGLQRDVTPEPGTLVLFDSAAVSHEALTTNRELLAVAGWMLERRGACGV